jgi:mono/diheme cytochrome c family protein
MKPYSLLLMTPLIAAAADPYAAQLFLKNCASCHASSAEAGARIPQMDVLKTLSPLTILRTLESGVMKPQAARLSSNERQALANYLGKPVVNERRREELANPSPASTPTW